MTLRTVGDNLPHFRHPTLRRDRPNQLGRSVRDYLSTHIADWKRQFPPSILCSIKNMIRWRAKTKAIRHRHRRSHPQKHHSLGCSEIYLAAQLTLTALSKSSAHIDGLLWQILTLHCRIQGKPGREKGRSKQRDHAHLHTHKSET